MKLSAAVVLIFCCLLSQSCVNDASYKLNRSTVPEQLGDGWEISSPDLMGLALDSLERVHGMLMDESRYYNALGLLVIKDGRLVFESYPRSRDDRDHVHHIQSATKSFTSIALGICKGRGLIESLDTPVHTYVGDRFPADPVKRTMTLRHVLTMRSGLRIDNSEFAYTMLVDKPRDPLDYILKLPLYAPPGDSMYYRDCDPQLVSYIIQRVSGMTEEQLLKEAVFDPLGITDYHWEPNPDGVTSGAYGLHLRPRDMAKVGQMILEKGFWKGKRILDSAWITESTVPMVSTVWEDVRWDYGFYWWVLPQFNAFTASGHGGQYICVIPDKRMVIVMISLPDTNDDYVGTSLKRFIGLVKPLLL